MSELDGVPRGRLKLAAEPLFGRAILARRFREFMARFPEVRTDVTLANDAAALIHHGQDLAIHLGPLPESRLVSRRIVKLRLSLYASSSYLEREGTPSETSQLKQHCIIRVAGHGPSGEALMPEAALDEVRVESAMTVNDLDMAYHAVLEGIGIALLPRYVIGQDVVRGTVKMLFPDVVATQPGHLHRIPADTLHLSSHTCVHRLSGRLPGADRTRKCTRGGAGVGRPDPVFSVLRTPEAR